MPRLSIIIPVHNRAELLPETLNSVRAQTFSEWECVVIDDHSTDESLSVAKRYAGLDHRFRVHQLGVGKRWANAARNLGFAKSHGSYVIFLDSDDLLAAWCLQGRFEAMQQHGELDFAVFSLEVFKTSPGDTGMLFNVDNGTSPIDRLLQLDYPFGNPAVIWRRQALIRLGPWDENLRRWQDWEYHIRALSMGLEFERFPLVDAYVRKGDPRRGKGTPAAIWKDREYLGATEKLFLKVENTLSGAGKLSRRRRLAMAGLHFRLAECLLSLLLPKEATRIWREAYHRQLVGEVLYLQGLTLLSLRRLRYVRYIVKKYILPTWKTRHCLSFESPTYCQVRLPITAQARARPSSSQAPFALSKFT
jgi:glycosyltransferase involved in cell wall biosynthesis